jgi:hypothetical protein
MYQKKKKDIKLGVEISNLIWKAQVYRKMIHLQANNVGWEPV